MEKLETFFADYQPRNILDIATGRGEFINYILNFFPEYEKIVAIDSDERMLKMAQENFADNEKIDFFLRDAYDLALGDKKFDLITISNSLHHFEDNQKLIDSCKPYLKEGGRFLISEMVSDNLSDAQKSHKMLHHFSAKIDRLHGRFHADTLSETEIIHRIQSLGLNVLDSYLYEHKIEAKQASEIADRMKEMIPRMVKAAEKFTEFKKITTESGKIIAWLDKYKFASASTLFVWCERK